MRYEYVSRCSKCGLEDIGKPERQPCPRCGNDFRPIREVKMEDGEEFVEAPPGTLRIVKKNRRPSNYSYQSPRRDL